MGQSYYIVNASDVVSSFIPAKKSLIGFYQSTALPGRHIGRIMYHNIPIQSKIAQELFVEVKLVCCVIENDFRIFPPTKPPSKKC